MQHPQFEEEKKEKEAGVEKILQPLLLIFKTFFILAKHDTDEQAYIFLIFMPFKSKTQLVVGKAGVDPAGIAGVI